MNPVEIIGPTTISSGPPEESIVTATYTFDVSSTLDGYGAHSGDWGGYGGGYWGKQAPSCSSTGRSTATPWS